MTCSLCASPTSNSYLICDECRKADVKRACDEHGVELVISDPVVLAPLGRLLRSEAKAS